MEDGSGRRGGAERLIIVGQWHRRVIVKLFYSKRSAVVCIEMQVCVRRAARLKGRRYVDAKETRHEQSRHEPVEGSKVGGGCQGNRVEEGQRESGKEDGR